MTISSATNTAGPFAGNGSTTAFPFAFKVFSRSELLLEVTDVDGVVSTLVLDSDYSVSLNADQDASPGGTITYPISGAALAVGETLIVSTDLPYTQLTDITNAGGFLPQVIEDALDRNVRLMQQQAERTARAVRAPLGEEMATLPPASERANKAFLFGPDGAPFVAAPASGSAADVMLQYASTDGGEGASLVGVADAGGYFTSTHVEGALQELGQDMRGRLRDVRTFPGIVADGVTDDFTALQAAIVTARTTGCGIYWPAGVKTFVQFSSAHPQIFVDGPVNWAGGDRFTSGIRFHCNYDMGNVHAPLFCWGIPSKGVAVNSVYGTIKGLGWFMTSGCLKFESLNHVYQARDFTVMDCFADFTATVFPQADASHPSGYQAAGFFRGNVQGAWAVGQTRNKNIKFLNNIGRASMEYQNGESLGFTWVDGIQYIGNHFTGWADDMAFHECTRGIMAYNYYEAVSGRYYIENSQHCKIVHNTIMAIPRPIVGGYLGPQRTYISLNMATQYAAITYDAPNEDITIADNTVIVAAGAYATAAIQCYGVQDGLCIENNTIWNWGGASPVSAITVSTMYRAGWAGPSWNQDYTAGGAIKLRNTTVSGNKAIGPGWVDGDGNLGVVVYAGGAASDVVGPVSIANNTVGAYYIPSYEAVRFGNNYGAAFASDPFLNVSMLALWDKQPPLWVGLLPASANVNNTNFPQATPTFYTLSDSDGLKFIAQRAGRVLGAHIQLTANMTAGNNCVLRVLKNGVQIGTDTDSTTNSPTTNPSRYTCNFAGVAGMTFAEGDKIELQVTIRTAQGATSIVGRVNLVAQYA